MKQFLLIWLILLIKLVPAQQTQLRLEGQPQKFATELVAVQSANGC